MIKGVPSVIGLSPFESPDTGLVKALVRAGALGVLDLGHDASRGREALAEIARGVGAFAVRVPEYVELAPRDLPAQATVVIVPASTMRFAWGERTVLAQVRSIDEARAAIAGGAHGLVVKGHEASGMVAEETTFILLQRVLAEVRLPIWAQGGIGLHTAAACIAAGAHGVVLDAQLALLEEARTSEPLRRALSAMDGSETIVAGGYRLYARPNGRAPEKGATSATIAAQLGSGDPANDLVTLGQDAAFAVPFAQRFGTVERLVRALHAAFDGHLRQARALRPLARHAPLAHELGTTFPIVQGPMTRVSDRAAFADDVATAGGLPFLALSLMRGAEARTLLDETRARLGDRAWGVGVLGFLPADLRDEQLALLKEMRPPVALIAGGRPSQAKPLEDAGIATFLHVPSPGLLEMFLKEGARRFVFEGRECGGHVGPRSSFVLWETMIEKLLTRDKLGDVSVLFAGGIHDARSARMVATLAAPLAARGVKIGVLMGTAYLFTEEAVRSGAIRPVFQDEALRCEATALLETAPGHATRCAHSAYVSSFERERGRLEAEGKDAQTVWEALEQLNLGRLRIASKGLVRRGDALVPLSDDAQHAEGMFMIGQVAALRHARCTIDELHRDVSDAGTASLADVVLPQAPRGRERAPVDVAIVGMACVFPGAPDLASFWTNVVVGKNSITEVGKDRWDPALYFDPTGTGEKTPSKWGGFLSPLLFDPAAYGIPPRSLAAIDPVQILALEVARRALEDAGCNDRAFDRERASVVFGAEAGTDLANAYGFRASFPRYIAGAMPDELEASLPTLTEDSFPGVLGNVIAGRIANRLDLRGVNYTVDAACASSLAAVDVACKELVSGASDLVVAGGADVHNGIHDFLMFASVHALSKTGQCKPFDATADGIALGEGVGAVVLKRLEDAERDGDRVYAVLRGVGGSSDGKSLGLTAPRKEGQIRALERAFANAGISPADVGLVEAHGTGTVVGDRTELATLSEFFGTSGALARTCTLGSVKSQIGHTKCAAGMAGLIKAALSVHHGVLPATKNVTTPNPGYDEASSPFVLRDTAAPWTSDTRIAGVSAFGFGGTNFHAVLSSHGAPRSMQPTLVEWPTELFVVRGATREDALRLLDALDAAASAEAPPSLRELAATAAHTNRGTPPRFALTATSLADLRAKLAGAHEAKSVNGVHVAEEAAGKVAFLFPGQGSQRPGMLAELFVAFPELRDLLDLGRPYQSRLFPGSPFAPDARAVQQRAITDTRVAQPVLGIADLAMARLLERFGVCPAMAGGHSYGELVALAVAGAFDADTLIELSEARARCILGAADARGGDPGSMAAVRATIAQVRQALADDANVVIANHNAHDQVVIAGPTGAIAAAIDRLTAAGVTARLIPVACAFHSPVVGEAQVSFAEELDGVDVFEPSFPVYANTTAAPYARDVASVRATLAAQIAKPVRFVDEIEAMYEAGARVFVEVGPGGVLSDLVGRILKGRPHAAVACDKGDGAGIGALMSALAKLVALGVDVDVEALFVGRAGVVDLASRFAAPATAWIVDGGGARPLHGELPAFAMKPLAAPVQLASAPSVVADDRERTVREYLRASQELALAQRDVMLRYLGESDSAPRVRALAVTEGHPALPHAKTLRGGLETAAASPKLSPLEALVATVSERTGYPADMLDPDLDLEADLGIDSIKRIEILGEMRDKLGLEVGGAASDAMVEKIAAVKTLRGIAQLLEAALAPGAGATPEPTCDEIPAPPSSSVQLIATVPPSGSVGRYVVEIESVPPPSSSLGKVAGKRFAIVADGLGVATRLAEQLRENGAYARILGDADAITEGEGLLYLETISTKAPGAVRGLFVRAQEATKAKAEWVLAATGLGGRFGHHAHARIASPDAAGVSGLLKSLAKERQDLRVRAVDLDPSEDPSRLARHVFDEIAADDSYVEVGYFGGERHTLVVAARLSSIPPPSRVEIDASSVVLFTGGARGITAQIAIAMARRFRCTLELVGRSPLVDDEDDVELRAASDAVGLRKLLVTRVNGAGPASPAAIDAHCKRILAAREVRETLTAIRAAGGRVDYHAVDVRDDAAFGALLDRLKAKHGRIDGVVHGAGLIEDKLLRDKTHESFDRVFSTKVAGARTLARKLADETSFFVLFSSVSGAFGNRGQTDYAAANDVLDKLAHHLHETVRGRVLSINWGPWRGVGMVRPELEREYERRGIGLIQPHDGIDRFFEELLGGSDPQVILTATHGEALA